MEQERLSRVKHAVDESPADALSSCLAFAGITLDDLDAVSLGSDHNRLIKWLGDDPDRCAEVRSYSSPERLFPPRVFGDREFSPPIEIVAHHTAHAASAYNVSDFDNAAAIIMDAMGEDTSTTIAVCRGTEIMIRKTYDVAQSLGYFYEAATSYAGFGPDEPGKLMGLSAYGSPLYPMPLAPPTDDDDRLVRIDATEHRCGRTNVLEQRRRLIAAFTEAAFPFEAGIAGEPMAYRDFAASAQAALERVILELAEKAVTVAASRKLVMAGGVALNCAANGKLAASGVVDELFVQPASTDAGVALGAALHASTRLYGSASQPGKMHHAYWGLSDSPESIRAELQRSRLPFEELTWAGMLDAVTKALSEGRIVAWHQGRAEVGPRALGARSLLGDPRTRATVVAMNKAKGRQVWRPLAPSVCIEDFESFFEGIPNPFMIIAVRVKPVAQRRIPAIVHVDGSARPQAVDRHHNPLFHKLLKQFEQMCGVPVLVNTSLNGNGEPICYSARDSIAFLRRSSAALLAIENFVVSNTPDAR